MRYFTYIAEQSFKTDDEGRRVFYLGSPASRPYVISDAATESRMFSKLTWFYRVFLTVLIVGQAFLIPRIIHQPLRFFAFLGAVMALQWVVLRIIFFNDLRKLARTPARPSMKTFYSGVGQRHSVKGLVLGLVGSLAFVAAGAAMIAADGNLLAVGLASIALFGVSAAAWAYAFRLKLAESRAESQ
jgi:hypothetical protein